MKPERMNAFTDGVIAILITILVLELRPPEGHHLADILDEKAKLLAYLMSFVFVAIYWVNHHHLTQFSLAAYTVALVCSFFVPWVSIALFVTVAIVWVIPDRRVERVIIDK